MPKQTLEPRQPECQSILKGLDSTRVEGFTLLRQRETHAVYRVSTQGGSFVLKCFQSRPPVKEIQVYELLQKVGVPTLPCYGMTDSALLLEDLETSPHWRPAQESDLRKAETGTALAQWYRGLHVAGIEVLNETKSPGNNLKPWVAVIQQAALEKAEAQLGLGNSAGWALANSACEALKAQYLSCPQTFNYNDFAGENLALSRGLQDRLEAIVYDYDQFSTGTAASDWRNVVYSLSGEAREAFIRTYGIVSEEEQRLDEVLSLLYGLITATGREKFPGWATPLREAVFNGSLEQATRAALGAF